LIGFQEVYRDAIQSLFGTNPSADEIIRAHPNAHLIGTDSIQTGGGTFFDLFAKKGRREWEEVEKILYAFKQKGVRQSALIRGDFLFGYEPQPYDVVHAMVLEYAKMGMNILQNFHGLNDIRVLKGVARAVDEVRNSHGFDIIAQGTICIEDNPNVTLDDCLDFAHELYDAGHDGFYLKSASGRLSPDFVRALVTGLCEEFPNQPITIHAHSTYGEAPACYMAAAEEAVRRGVHLTMDVQHPALAGLTAHPSMLKMQSLIENNPDPLVRAHAPVLNRDAIKADMPSLYELRFRYREFESRYNKELLDAMREARTPGGASATLKAIPGLVENLGRLLGTKDWDKIQIEIYKMQAEILPDLGNPTQVTPYAANTTGQAALSLWHVLEGRDKYHTLYPGMANYLAGKHGRVPDGVNPALKQKALTQLNLSEPVDYVSSEDRPDGMKKARAALQALGIKLPSTRQTISAAVIGEDHAAGNARNKLTPQPPPDFPAFVRSDLLKTLGGISTLQRLAEQSAHLIQIRDEVFIFPQTVGDTPLKDQWRDDTLKSISDFMDSLPKKLQDARVIGFLPGREVTGSQPSLAVQHRMAEIQGMIKDACDAKGTGIYGGMMDMLVAYRRDAGVKPAVKIVKNDGGFTLFITEEGAFALGHKIVEPA
jgi:pyruvate/oxaloacetate carboxyltransferase